MNVSITLIEIIYDWFRERKNWTHSFVYKNCQVGDFTLPHRQDSDVETAMH